MSTIKESVISLLKDLPDDVDMEEIMYHLYVKQKILRGKEQLAQGKTHTHEEVKEMARKWVK